jgi:cytochrome c nitrite reductase small subunit
VSRASKLILFVGFVVLGPAVGLLTGVYSFVQAEKVSFCASCHTMTPWIRDLEDPNSRSLVSHHYRNRFIPHDQCYTCHVDYDFLGPIDAKIRGIRHAAIHYFGNATPKDIKLYKPFSNGNCLRCHAGSARFLQNPAHWAVMVQILADQMRCYTCHQPVHTPEFDSVAQAAVPSQAQKSPRKPQ